MTEKTIIYIKQTGESPIPVTARLEWLPDGKIQPCAYWTPDGSRFVIMHIYEKTPIAFLKERGEGLRFKIEAKMAETPDWDDDLLDTQYDTYLYLVDSMFSGKNFIDERYNHDRKEYIPVTLDVYPNGEYDLVYFTAQGMRYMVEKTITVEPRGSFQAGGVGVWHNVEIRQINGNNDEDYAPDKPIISTAGLYFEINKWFVALKGERNKKGK